MVERRQDLDRHQRLRRRREFLDVYARGDKLRGEYFYLYILPQPQREVARLGITASRKVGPPIVRNKLKRRMRSVFRLHKPVIRPDCDVVVNLRSRAALATYLDLEQEYLRLAHQWGRRQAHQ